MTILITPKPNLVKGQLGNGPLVKKPTWNPTIRDNGSIGNVSTWIMFYWKLYLGLNHLGIRGLPIVDRTKNNSPQEFNFLH